MVNWIIDNHHFRFMDYQEAMFAIKCLSPELVRRTYNVRPRKIKINVVKEGFVRWANKMGQFLLFLPIFSS